MKVPISDYVLTELDAPALRAYGTVIKGITQSLPETAPTRSNGNCYRHSRSEMATGIGSHATGNRLDSISGHLLVETAPRFGLAASLKHLEERLPGGRRDQL
jgi:hypothetical protein